MGLAWWFLIDSTVAAATPVASPLSQSTPVSKPTLQEQVVGIAPGSLVEVRLKTKQKLRGRMGAVSSDGFTLTLANKAKVEDRSVAFRDVKSIKLIGKHSKAGTIVAFALLGALVVIAITAVVIVRNID